MEHQRKIQVGFTESEVLSMSKKYRLVRDPVDNRHILFEHDENEEIGRDVELVELIENPFKANEELPFEEHEEKAVQTFEEVFEDLKEVDAEFKKIVDILDLSTMTFKDFKDLMERKRKREKLITSVEQILGQILGYPF